MKLQTLFEGEAAYISEGAWIHPRGDAAGYAEGDGTIAGSLAGALRWSNCARRRADGRWLIKISGLIETTDHARILIKFFGRSLPEEAAGTERDVIMWATFETDDDRYDWCNDLAAIIEARFDPQRGRMWMRAYRCGNELSPDPGPRVIHETERSGV